jgi:hypothetical protein
MERIAKDDEIRSCPSTRPSHTHAFNNPMRAVTSNILTSLSQLRILRSYVPFFVHDVQANVIIARTRAGVLRTEYRYEERKLSNVYPSLATILAKCINSSCARSNNYSRIIRRGLSNRYCRNEIGVDQQQET